MPRAPKTKHKKAEKKLSWYVLFGFSKADHDQTGYFSKSHEIVEDIESARRFPSMNISNVSGFGTPEQWKEFINSDSDLNHGFKFHLVKTSLSS